MKHKREDFLHLLDELVEIYERLDLRRRDPFKRSRLSPYRDLILLLDAANKKSPEIADILRDMHSVNVHPRTVRRFIVKHTR